MSRCRGDIGLMIDRLERLRKITGSKYMKAEPLSLNLRRTIKKNHIKINYK